MCTVDAMVQRRSGRREWRPWPSYGLALGRKLAQLRRLRGLTQDQLATLSDVSRNSISNIERNLNNAGTATDPRLSTLYRLARALDVPPAALLPGGDRLVADICSAEGLGISLRWPAGEGDLRPFRPRYVDHGHGPRYEALPGSERPREAELPEGESPDGLPEGGDLTEEGDDPGASRSGRPRPGE